MTHTIILSRGNPKNPSFLHGRKSSQNVHKPLTARLADLGWSSNTAASMVKILACRVPTTKSGTEKTSSAKGTGVALEKETEVIPPAYNDWRTSEGAFSLHAVLWGGQAGVLSAVRSPREGCWCQLRRPTNLRCSTESTVRRRCGCIAVRPLEMLKRARYSKSQILLLRLKGFWVFGLFSQSELP